MRCTVDANTAQQLVQAFPPGLNKLVLKNNQLDDGAWKMLGDHFPLKLAMLEFNNQRIGDADIKSLFTLRSANLTEFSVSCMKAGGLILSLVQVMPPNLSALSLSECSLKDAAIRALAPSLSSSLKQLCLESNCIGPDGVKALAESLRNSHITHLNLGNNYVGDIGAQALAKSLPQTLTELDLSHNEIGDIGAQAIALSRAVNLAHITFRYNDIGDVGACALAKNMGERLVGLDLAFNPIGDDGVKALASSVKKSTRLEKFGVYNKQDTSNEIALCALTKSVLLSRALLSDLWLPHDTMEIWLKVLPECFIEDANAVRNRLAHYRFRREEQAPILMSKIEKWTEQKVLIRRTFYACQKPIINDVVNVILMFVLERD